MGLPEMGGVLALLEFLGLGLDAGHDGDHADQDAGILAAEALLLAEIGAIGIGLRRGKDEVAELHGHGQAAARVGGTDPAANRRLDGADAALLMHLGGIHEPCAGWAAAGAEPAGGTADEAGETGATAGAGPAEPPGRQRRPARGKTAFWSPPLF